MEFMRNNISEIKHELDVLRTDVSAKVDECKKVQIQLDIMSSECYKRLQKEIFEPESNRLARLRMTIPTTEQFLHERVMGQFCECERLLKLPNELTEELKVLNDEILAKSHRIRKLEAKLLKQ